MTLEGKTVAVLTTDETDTREYEPIVQALRDEGAGCVIVGPDLESIERICLEADCPVHCGMDVGSARALGFDALVIPGGRGLDALLHNDDAIDFVAELDSQRRPIAVIGRGLLMLVAADRLENRHVAAMEDLRDDVEAVGGIVVLGPYFKEHDGGWWITAVDTTMLGRVAESLVCELQAVTITAEERERKARE